MKDKITHVITVHQASDSYIARGNGKTASCTSEAMWAVERVARKLKGLPTDIKKSGYVPFEQSGISIKPVTSGTWLAEWEAA